MDGKNACDQVRPERAADPLPTPSPMGLASTGGAPTPAAALGAAMEPVAVASCSIQLGYLDTGFWESPPAVCEV